MVTIRLHELRLESLVGTYPHERHRPQPVILHLTLVCDADAAVRSDRLADAVDYDALTQRVTRVVTSAQCQLIEALAGLVLDELFTEPKVQAATVRLVKPGALPQALVEVELSRQR